MPLKLNFSCDLCGKKINLDTAVIGSSPVRFTIEDIVTGNTKESIVCSVCWPYVHKALANINLPDQSDSSEK